MLTFTEWLINIIGKSKYEEWIREMKICRHLNPDGDDDKLRHKMSFVPIEDYVLVSMGWGHTIMPTKRYNMINKAWRVYVKTYGNGLLEIKFDKG